LNYNKKQLDEVQLKKAIAMLSNNLPLMLKNHFTRVPPSWQKGKIVTADFLKEIKKQIVYEDEKVLCVVPEKPQCIGHLNPKKCTPN